MGIFFSEGNSKLEKTGKALGRKIVAFNLPPDLQFRDASGVFRNTCPGASACKGVCYAKQGRMNMPAAIARRMENLDATRRESFVADALLALDATKADTVRIHDSGDFYSQAYLDAWCAIATARPNVTFYAYTKSLHLNWSAAPSNLSITQSLGGKYDNLLDVESSHSRIFATHAAREAAGYVDGNIDDSPAILGLVKIGLVYHGNKKLTDAQAKFFA